MSNTQHKPFLASQTTNKLHLRWGTTRRVYCNQTTKDLDPVSDPPAGYVMCDYCRQTLAELMTAIAGSYSRR